MIALTTTLSIVSILLSIVCVSLFCTLRDYIESNKKSSADEVEDRFSSLRDVERQEKYYRQIDNVLKDIQELKRKSTAIHHKEQIGKVKNIGVGHAFICKRDGINIPKGSVVYIDVETLGEYFYCSVNGCPDSLLSKEQIELLKKP
jgi:hypothetical protein